MSLISESVVFIVDSSKAISGSGAQFSFKLNMPKGKEFDRVAVLQAIIPKSYYLVNAPFNTMTLTENGVNTTVTLVEGNYNVISFSTLIGALLTSSSSQGWTYTISFPDPRVSVDTGLFTYTVSGNGSLQPSFTFPANGVHEQFGMHPGGTMKFVANQMISEHVVKFQVEDVIFIHSDISYNEDQSAGNDVLQEIYCSSTPNFTNVVYQNSGAVEVYSKKLLSGDKNIYNFSLTDENQNPINLRGLYCVITIVVYKKNNIDQLIAKDLLEKNKAQPSHEYPQYPGLIPQSPFIDPNLQLLENSYPIYNPQ